MMTESLVKALRTAASETPPTWEELAKAIRPRGLPDDPWARRLLVVLHRHVPRQRWVARVAHELLRANLPHLATDGAFGHPDHIPQQGPVPGLSGCSYFFHGRGCCITTSDGEDIDVDFDEHGGDAIDPWFFQRYLDSMKADSPLERSVADQGSFREWWMADLSTLVTGGWLVGNHRVVLTPSGADLAASLEPLFVEASESESPLRRTWLWTLLEDFSTARGHCAGTAAESACQQLAHGQVSARADRLRSALERGDRHALAAIGKLGRRYAEADVCKQLEKRPPMGTTSTALELVEHWGAQRFVQRLLDLADASSGLEPPEPHVRVTALRIILSVYTPESMPKAS